ncbi:MAG: ABC transporter permease [Thermodesulfobacteriota bacterium]
MINPRTLRHIISGPGLVGLVSLLAGAVLLWVAGASPIEGYVNIIKGALGSTGKFFFVVRTWVPLAICACGLIYPFRAGLLNIGVEGQMIWGAVCCTVVLRWAIVWGSPALTVMLAFAAAAAGGALWAMLAGILKIKGGVNEIFGGLGLTFVAQGVVLWLIFGPWKRPGVATMSGTEIFSPDLWLPTVLSGRISPAAILLTVMLFALTVLLLTRTNLGLYFQAVRSSQRAAFVLGLNPSGYFLLALAISGGCAGLAGAVLVAGVYHCLIPSISGNYGYLALLVVMLADHRIGAAAVVAFLFAGLNVGGVQLPLVMHLDSSLSGILQGALVLTALAVYGRRRKRRGPEWTV